MRDKAWIISYIILAIIVATLFFVLRFLCTGSIPGSPCAQFLYKGEWILVRSPVDINIYPELNSIDNLIWKDCGDHAELIIKYEKINTK